jgi:hypothetical protein
VQSNVGADYKVLKMSSKSRSKFLVSQSSKRRSRSPSKEVAEHADDKVVLQKPKDEIVVVNTPRYVSRAPPAVV